MDVFQRKAHKELKAGASFGAGVMRRNWLSHMRLSAYICGFVFPTQFIDAEIAARIILFLWTG